MKRKVQQINKALGYRHIILALSLVLVMLLAACGGSATPEDASTSASVVKEAASDAVDAPAEKAAVDGGEITFNADILPILTNTCERCHGGTRSEEGLRLLTFEQIMAGSNNGPVVVPGDPENSLLVKLLVEGKMPKRGTKLTPEQVQMISDWVAAGAENN